MHIFDKKSISTNHCIFVLSLNMYVYGYVKSRNLSKIWSYDKTYSKVHLLNNVIMTAKKLIR